MLALSMIATALMAAFPATTRVSIALDAGTCTLPVRRTIQLQTPDAPVRRTIKLEETPAPVSVKLRLIDTPTVITNASLREDELARQERIIRAVQAEMMKDIDAALERAFSRAEQSRQPVITPTASKRLKPVSADCPAGTCGPFQIRSTRYFVRAAGQGSCANGTCGTGWVEVPAATYAKSGDDWVEPQMFSPVWFGPTRTEGRVPLDVLRDAPPTTRDATAPEGQTIVEHRVCDSDLQCRSEFAIVVTSAIEPAPERTIAIGASATIDPDYANIRYADPDYANASDWAGWRHGRAPLSILRAAPEYMPGISTRRDQTYATYTDRDSGCRLKMVVVPASACMPMAECTSGTCPCGPDCPCGTRVQAPNRPMATGSRPAGERITFTDGTSASWNGSAWIADQATSVPVVTYTPAPVYSTPMYSVPFGAPRARVCGPGGCR